MTPAALAASIIVLVVLLVVLMAIAALGVVLARKVVQPKKSRTIPVIAIAEGAVTLPRDETTTAPGTYGLWLEPSGEHVRVGAVSSVEDETVNRGIIGATPSAQDTAGRWSGHLFAGPGDLGLPWGEVFIDTDFGSAPAWLITPEAASGDVWAVHIHGHRTTRITAIRTVPAATAAGMISLVPSFSGDGEAPGNPGGVSTLGRDEAADVERAIAYAAAHGAKKVHLFGWSLGGGIALQIAEGAQPGGLLGDLVLVCPVTNWELPIANGARKAGLPVSASKLAAAAMRSKLLTRLIGLPSPLDIRPTDFTGPGRLTLRTLAIHSTLDSDVPFTGTEAFGKAHPHLVTVVPFEVAGHGWEYNSDPGRFDDAIVNWLHTR